ncbi:RNA 3'-terminal phosphate cyclase-domain-containing protein [Podospora aff. communis PSN243]|uniref:RNA 3'-terminal phosphate cyclase-domain-containing protein n=1 Tax=Podospora aff. communis PSN243 TaxID=3040156 RepID=A0AAV9GGB9_9PEZI|nr:RNA 3'-terminal phosphate cyclase-domain-containing protein [Podospora aff. communis PSN243]
MEAEAIEIDGRTGEGGGQLVRVACALAAVTSQAIKVINVRGNREGPRLKSQHVTSLTWLTKATNAEVTGLTVGSHTVEFRPRLKPWDLKSRKIKIDAESSAASTLLIFQAIFPFLLFASNDRGDPIQVTITGGTNVSFSLSYEYLDQVLLPSLERMFGIKVERTLKNRGWSLGKVTRGTVLFKLHPLKADEPLRLLQSDSDWTDDDLEVVAVDASIVAPVAMHGSLCECLSQDLGDFFPGADVTFKVVEDSGEDTRVYVLLVAKSEAGPIWGRDILTSIPKKSRGKDKNAGAKATASFSESVARKVSKDLFAEVSSGGVVDEFLQDQLVIFQALAEDRSSFPRTGIIPSETGTVGTDPTAAALEEALQDLDLDLGTRERKDKTDEPFGEGSTHTQTARWVVAKLLPQVRFFNKGRICEGVGMVSERKYPEQQLSRSS